MAQNFNAIVMTLEQIEEDGAIVNDVPGNLIQIARVQ